MTFLSREERRKRIPMTRDEMELGEYVARMLDLAGLVALCVAGLLGAYIAR